MEGPRALRPDEVDALGAMYGRKIERIALGIFMRHNPNLFNDQNFDDLQVFKEGDRICSHVGLSRFHITAMGRRFSSGCIGGVHTHDDFRKQGLATRLLQHVFERFRNDGGDFLAISGRRDLYYRNHAMIVGASHRFTISPVQADSLADPKVAVRELTEDLLRDLARIHAAEPVRTLRPRRVWDFFRQTGSCHFAPSTTFVASIGGAAVAYVIVQRENREGVVEAREMAGDRAVLCASLAHVLRRQKGKEISLVAMGWDLPLIARLRVHGAEPKSEAASGTIRVINFEQTLEKYRPRLEELLGRREANELALRANADGVVFSLGADRITLGVDAATKLLFGAPPGEERPSLGRSALAEALEAGFPIPLPSYGMDYV